METDDIQDDELSPLRDPVHISKSRSKTMPPTASQTTPNLQRTQTSINLDRLKNAKLNAEKAMKNRKVFMIQGPYPAIRQSLRERGWVEKFYRMNADGTPKKSPRSKKKRKRTADTDDDNTDDDDDEDADDDSDPDDPNADDPNDHGCKIPPWEEEHGIYGIMSRVVRNASPSFIWSVRRDVVDPKAMKREQIINHYGKAGSFTTKVGLCVNMRNLPWFQEANPDTYFPRCYKFSQEEEKQAFIDDYRLTACINILKLIKEQEANDLKKPPIQEETTNAVCVNPECTRSRPNSNQSNRCMHASSSSINGNHTAQKKGAKQKKITFVPPRTVEIAILRCERYLQCLNHDDLDEEADSHFVSDQEWDEFLQWYYKVIHDGAVITNTEPKTEKITSMLLRLQEQWPQWELDGIQNVWMVKAGAKSRGRGIVPYDRLEEMLKLVSSSVVQKEGKYVVQKYIERPLLVYNTKFDIRQWFLVTDWNPLTIWFYKDSYIRFCSQEYTLDNFDESIHLSNNAIQKNYESNPNRSKYLPLDNMWHCDDFKDFLKRRGHLGVWDEVIYPGMKNAALGALLCSQDIVEYRKNSFELYGADFMLTEDLQPWLIEINCSPSMSASTRVTAKLCSSVLSDTVKVVIDRKYDKNADIGLFELAYKQPYVHVPPYIGINLVIEGAAVKKPAWMKKPPVVLNVPEVPAPPQPNFDISQKSSNTNTSTSTDVTPSSSKTSQVKVPKIGTLSYTTTAKVQANNTDTKQPKQSQTTPSKSYQKAKIRRTPVKSESKTDNVDADKTTSGKGLDVVTSSSYMSDEKLKSIHVKGKSTGPSLAQNTKGFRSKKRLSVRPNSARDIGVNTNQKPTLRMTRCSSTVESKKGSDSDVSVSRSATPRCVTPRCVTPRCVTPYDTSNPRLVTATSLQRQAKPKQVLSAENLLSAEISAASTTSERSLILKNADSVDIQMMQEEANKTYMLCSPLLDSSWGRTCNQCGSGMNLRLDTASSKQCDCQKDSIRLGDTQWHPRTASLARNGNPLQTPHQTALTVNMSFPARPFIPHPPSLPPKPFSLLPKPIYIDTNKLVSSVYQKASNYSHPLSNNLTRSGKFVLKYTDANIPKPAMTTKIITKSFPKLVSRYIGKRVNKDGVPISIDPYKKSIISQSFL